MLGAIAEGTTIVHGFLASEDCLATQAALEAMGVAIERNAARARPNRRRRRSRAAARRATLSTSATPEPRSACSWACSRGSRSTAQLTGDASLRQRPMERVAAPLRLMGARITTATGGRPPVMHRRRRAAARHRLRAADGERAGEVGAAARGAQSPAARRRCARRARAATTPSACCKAWAYVSACRLTARGTRSPLNGPATLRGFEIRVPGRFQLGGVLSRRRLSRGARRLADRERRHQSDAHRVCLTILREMGAAIELRNERSVGAEPVADLWVTQSELKGIAVPPELVPLAIDEFPILFVAAAAAKGETIVSGADELRKKETDRIAVMARGARSRRHRGRGAAGRRPNRRRPHARRHGRQPRRSPHRDVVRGGEPACAASASRF